jgi:glyoxylase-like metal-dependent hydrolase (beta-lactamase superfamily II)
MKLHTINTGLFKLDGGAMHGVVPKSMWNKANPADENNMCSWAMRCMLIEDGNRLILIDTGMGNKQDEKFFSFFHPHGEDSLQKSIESKGFGMDQITDVFLTHLHFDHCGGAIQRENGQLVTAFKNATYWSTESHWKSALQPNAREKASFLKENILPIQESGQLQFIERKDGIAFTDHIQLYFMQGHTDDMMLPLIHHPNGSILYCADLVPSLAHISLPWVMGYDMQPLYTLKEKETMFTRAIHENWMLFFEHDLHHELCTLQQTDRGIKPKETLKLSELA